MTQFCLKTINPSFKPIVLDALSQLSPNYLNDLQQSIWLPGPNAIFNAFSIPLEKVKVVLLGESPYPRASSANGYAFWDGAVESLWSNTGLSKAVNRATSLRNFIKMLLVAKGLLQQDTSQGAIATLDKTNLIQTNDELFQNLLNNGFLLLNATPVFRQGLVNQDAKAWQPFLGSILQALHAQKPKLLLFGKIAQKLEKLQFIDSFDKLIAEHPYNLSFVQNKDIINFFKPLRLLDKLILLDTDNKNKTYTS